MNWFLPAVMSMISISIGQNPYLCRKCRQQVIDKSPVYVCYRTNVEADDDSNSTAPPRMPVLFFQNGDLVGT